MNQLLGTKTACSGSYGKEKTPSPLLTTRRQGESQQRKSLWYETNRTPATQNKKSKWSKGAEYENQINTPGGINTNTLTVDTDNKINNCYNHFRNPKLPKKKRNNGGAGAT